MSKTLLIVESPSKCSTLKKILGAGYDVKASVGHIRSIPKKGMNIDIKNGFEPKYEITHDKKQVVKDLKAAAVKADNIILASDSDREGEAIGFSVFEQFNAACKKKCVRATFDEITPKVVLAAVKDTREIDMDLVNAQKARQVLDRLIGYKISPLLWFTVGSGLSAGRVQSIALKIVCERENEIKNFKPVDYWLIDSLLQGKNGDFWAKVITKDKDNRYMDEKISKEDFEKLKKATFKVSKVEKKEVKRKAQAPFDTASLQSTCSSLFGWSTKKTAMLSQKLYEQGKVTYIRTDSYSISKEAIGEVRKFIGDSINSDYLPSKPNAYSKKSKAAAQEAHECIRPTNVVSVGDDVGDLDQQKLYKLIRSRFVACQMSDMKVNTVVYHIDASTKHKLIAKGQAVKFDGWSKVYKYSSTKEELLPECVEGEKLDLMDIKCTKHATNPPPRYKEGSLVTKMEKDGVGRPSTYASIMEAIQKRGYVDKVKGKKGSLEATELGLNVFNYLQPNFKDFFMDLKFTAEMEDDLDKIAHGDKTFLEVVQTVYDFMQAAIKKAEAASPKNKDVSTGEKCLTCDGGYVVQKHGKFGDFFSCDQYPTCKTIFVKDEEGKFSIKKKAVQKDTGSKCPECKQGNIVERKSKHGVFFACNRFPACKTIVNKEEDGTFTKPERKKKSY
tara:strand:- start:21169 stop:23181 length:2013 start_codon:yes stop_codon:yes gene_type:complete